jgi:hypothetical protein
MLGSSDSGYLDKFSHVSFVSPNLTTRKPTDDTSFTEWSTIGSGLCKVFKKAQNSMLNLDIYLGLKE